MILCKTSDLRNETLVTPQSSRVPLEKEIGPSLVQIGWLEPKILDFEFWEILGLLYSGWVALSHQPSNGFTSNSGYRLRTYWRWHEQSLVAIGWISPELWNVHVILAKMCVKNLEFPISLNKPVTTGYSSLRWCHKKNAEIWAHFGHVVAEIFRVKAPFWLWQWRNSMWHISLDFRDPSTRLCTRTRKS